jgi:hypothetical protein
VTVCARAAAETNRLTINTRTAKAERFISGVYPPLVED